MAARRHNVQPHAQLSLNRTCSGHQPHDTPSLMFQRRRRVSEHNFGALVIVKAMRLVAQSNHYGNICCIVAQFKFLSQFPW
jgi:hypothetical protein